MSAEMERILAEQRACADHIAAGSPDSEGACAGLHDWIAEEVLMRLEGEPPKCRTKPQN